MHQSALSHAGDGLSALAHAAGGAARPLALDLNGPGRYLHWSFIEISLANLIVIVLMIVVFILALLLPFPRGRDSG